MEKVDLIIEHAAVFNSYLKKFRKADVSVLNGRFFYIDTEGKGAVEAKQHIDGTGMFMLPGLIDIHMHIESSMMTPRAFGDCVAGYGVTTIVSEPHEMANVKGAEGVHEMIRAAADAPIDIFYGIPSSVPSTNEMLETTGGIIDASAMKELLMLPEVICVGEIMNYRGIIRENKLEITKFLNYLKQEKPQYIIEGHCPALTDVDLAKFLYLGIDADHTEHNLKEVKQRLENGMFLELQDKMLKPEILSYIRDNHLYEHCAFVTDDTMADSLWEEGQLNKVVEKAIAAGFPLEEAIYCATYTPARRMNLKDRGSIAPGRIADFMLLSDISVMEPDLVYKRGMQIFDKSCSPKESGSTYHFPADFCRSVILEEPTEEMFRIPVEADVSRIDVRVIEVLSDRTQTKETTVTMPVKDHILQWEQSGCLLAAVFERHGKNGGIGYGFLTGACFKEGAAATTYFHDHHNLMATGTNPGDICLAVSRLLALNGGIITVKDGRILAELALPIGGILSNRPAGEIGKAVKQIRQTLTDLGYTHYNPIMSFATLGLPVSPALKLTDKGLIDVSTGAIVPLFK